MTEVPTSDGISLYARAEGTGSPVLFIHEFAGDHRTWDGQLSALHGQFRCITYSARGYLPSDVPPDQSSYSYLRAADDAIDVLNAFGVDKAHIVGLSMGGFCALQLGIRYPERVRSLLVASAGSGATPSPTRREAFLAETEAVAAAFRTQGSPAVAAKIGVGPNRVQLQRKNPLAWDEFVRHLGEHSAEGSALTILGVQRARPSLYDLTDQLRTITAPTLVLNGDEDEGCLDPGLLLKRTIPTAGLQVLPNAGHALNLEEPERFNNIVRGFIDKVESDRWPGRDPRSYSARIGVLSETR